MKNGIVKLDKYSVSKDLLNSCGKLHSSYNTYLEEEQRDKKLAKENIKRKLIQEEIAEIKGSKFVRKVYSSFEQI